MRSLRARIFLGALLWMGALTVMLHTITGVILHRGPTTPDRQLLRLYHFSSMTALGIVFLAGGLWLVRRGLAPLDELRTRLTNVREGREREVEGSYPTEVQPLVSDLNALLADRERAVERAIATAGDLAHGLKTPLAILLREAERADDEVAANIRQQVERMRRQVEYHLAHARANASAGVAPGVRCSVPESAHALARTMRQLHADRVLTIDVHVPAEQTIRGRREDLDEMLGNLVDNACKWARAHVRIESSAIEGNVVIVVDDDGPGLDPSMRDSVLQRGVRADETAPGSGLGLAIVRDLAALYGGSITLLDSPLGGLRARLALPASV
jgi:signal transduction histidine kinase